MKSYVRFLREPHRRYPASRNHLIKPRIGYLYRADGEILAFPYAIADENCRDGEMLRVPPQSFVDVYYARILPRLKNDAEQQATAVYFDPYTGRFIVVGDKQLYLDAKDKFGIAGVQLYLEDESPFSFDPMTYGELCDPDTAEYLTFADYFVPDVTGVSIADCMVQPTWDDRTAPWQCAIAFVDKYYDRLIREAGEVTSDTLTTLLVSVIACGNHVLLARLLLTFPQLIARFRPTLSEEEKFAELPIDGFGERIQNLFHYLILSGDVNCLAVLFRIYEHPLQLREFLRHPMYYSVGHHHVKSGNHAALQFLLSHGFNADAVDAQNNRTPLVLAACRARMPAMLEMLLSSGGNPTRRDKRGLSAIDLAAAQNDCVAMQMMLEAIPEDTAKSIVTELAPNLPLSDDNQAMLGVLKKYL